MERDNKIQNPLRIHTQDFKILQKQRTQNSFIFSCGLEKQPHKNNQENNDKHMFGNRNIHKE